MAQRIGHIILILTLLASAACTKQPSGGEVSAALVPVQIALRVGNSSGGVATKGNPSAITEMNQEFRGINSVTMVPFSTRGYVNRDDISLYHPFHLSDITPEFYQNAVNGNIYVSGLVENNNARLYPKSEAYLPAGTASVLVYGRPPEVAAATTVDKKHLNGSLSSEGLGQMPTLRSASDITFSPDQIFGEGLPGEAAEIAGILNDIASGVTYTTQYWYSVNGIWNRGSVTVSWNEAIGDVWLKELFRWFTNGGSLSTGAGHNVEYMISRLYRILKDEYNSSGGARYEHSTASNVYTAMKEEGGTTPMTWSDLYNGIKNEIVTRIEALDNTDLNIAANHSVTFSKSTLRTYPAVYGLPEGAAIVRWNGICFEAVSETLDGVAPLSQYCYPPDLWYFVNTTISTSTKEKDELYTSANPSWKDDILSEYRNGKVLHSDTKAAALDSSLQYSCAMLVTTVRASAEQLDDADGLYSTQVSLGTVNLPVTGVIVGSQVDLNFDFTPFGSTEYYLYDNCISGVYLKKAEQASAPAFKTLVSQTPDNEPVYFCLELRNDSGAAFTGADGLVLPGSNFYLVGAIELPGDDSYTRVFERDHTTTINCLVSSLADARTAVPDLEHPHLSVGLQVNPNWKESTPSSLIMY